MVAVSSRRKPVYQSRSTEPPPWSIQAATLSDRGQVRDGNEDSVYLEPSGSHEARARGLLCVVADGMGGYAAGEVASRLAVQGVRNRYYAGPSTFIVDALRTAIESTNLDVWQYSQRQPETAGMGCTLTAAVILGDDLIVGHVGDSRAYLVRNNGIAQLTKDHSWVEEQVDAGAITREQANRHPQRNVILRALGAKSAIVVDIVREKVLDGDVVVLCSDGLSTLVSDDEIGRMAVDASPDQAVRQLVAVANQRGAPDNVTAAVLRVHGPPRRWFSRFRRWWPLGAAAVVLLAVAATLAIATRDSNPPASGPDVTPTTPPAAVVVSTAISSAPTAGVGAPTPSPPRTTAVPAPTPDFPQTGQISEDLVVLRSTPARNGAPKTSFNGGELVTILGRVVDDTPPNQGDIWLHVRVQQTGVEGYVFVDFVKLTAVSPVPSVLPTPRAQAPTGLARRSGPRSD